MASQGRDVSEYLDAEQTYMSIDPSSMTYKSQISNLNQAQGRNMQQMRSPGPPLTPRGHPHQNDYNLLTARTANEPVSQLFKEG